MSKINYVVENVKAFINRKEREVQQNRISRLMIKYDQQRHNLQTAYLGSKEWPAIKPHVNTLDDIHFDLKELLKNT